MLIDGIKGKKRKELKNVIGKKIYNDWKYTNA